MLKGQVGQTEGQTDRQADRQAESVDLCGDADGTSVEVTFAHHRAAENNERSRGETHFIRTQQRSYHHITTYSTAPHIAPPHTQRVIDHTHSHTTTHTLGHFTFR